MPTVVPNVGAILARVPQSNPYYDVSVILVPQRAVQEVLSGRVGDCHKLSSPSTGTVNKIIIIMMMMIMMMMMIIIIIIIIIIMMMMMMMMMIIIIILIIIIITTTTTTTTIIMIYFYCVFPC